MTVLALFPLGTVLFPGLVLPLHVFEERYRALVRDLRDQPADAPRQFGVVAIKRGWEVDGNGAPVSLYDVGCTAEIREMTDHPDGTFDLVTVGRKRFEIVRMITGGTPYLRAEVRHLPEPAADDAEADRLAPGVLAAFRSYLRLVRTDGEEVGEQLPEDPVVLSHLVAATAALTLDDRQQLLAAPDAAARLRSELRLLHREATLLGHLRAVPVAVSELPVRPGPN
jgi:Lon protease-like protein